MLAGDAPLVLLSLSSYRGVAWEGLWGTGNPGEAVKTAVMFQTCSRPPKKVNRRRNEVWYKYRNISVASEEYQCPHLVF